MNRRSRKSGNKIKVSSRDNKMNEEKKLVLLVLVCFVSVVFLYTFTFKDGHFDATVNNIMYSSIYVHAQMNSPNGSSTTMLGSIVIPPNSNDTMTTAVSTNNTGGNVSSTAINKTNVAQNVTSAVNFLKEDPTFPISPTGISTQGLQQPPDHRIVNNSNIPVFK
jgi:hypothetical protein